MSEIKGIFHNAVRLCFSGFIVLSVIFFSRILKVLFCFVVCLGSYSYSQCDKIPLLLCLSRSHQGLLVILMSVHFQLCVSVGVQWRSKGVEQDWTLTCLCVADLKICHVCMLHLYICIQSFIMLLFVWGCTSLNDWFLMQHICLWAFVWLEGSIIFSTPQ